MPSLFAWLDHSERERRRVLDVIDQFRETDTRDELGLGPLRDGFADLFFPGTSTIQTRARYFLFVPWVYQRMEGRGSAGHLAKRVRDEEVKVRNALMSSGDDAGVIGKLKASATKRLPSSIYWLGLKSWGIRLFPGSQDEYHRGFERRQRSLADVLRDDDGELVSGGSVGAWHPHLPAPPPDFPEKASFALTPAEARYLQERVTFSAPRSFLAFLVQNARSLDAQFPWEHPQFGELPAEVRGALEHARNLAETMHGAALLYNLMLSEELPPGDDRDAGIEEFRSELAAWASEMTGREHALEAWNRRAFWELVDEIANVGPLTRRFVETWLGMAPWRGVELAIESAPTRNLIRERELRLKGKARARIGNARALEIWSGSAGTARLSYRWGAALRVLADIRAGVSDA